MSLTTWFKETFPRSYARWDEIVLGAVFFVFLAILAFFVQSLPDLDFSRLTLGQLIAAVGLSVIGMVVGVAIHRVSHKFTIEKRLVSFETKLDGWKKPLEDWQKAANGVLHALETERVKEAALLMEPSQYAGFISKVNKEFFESKGAPASTIRLCGSMVGFSFLLPSALRSHACQSQTHFKYLKLVGLDFEPSGKDNICWFSVYLVAQTVSQMWSEDCCVRDLVINKGHTIIIDIRYVPHDLLAAVIDLPNKSLAVLQSLDPASFSQILNSNDEVDFNKKRYQLGFQFDDQPGGADEYSRYSNALDHIWQTYKNRSEVWMLNDFGKDVCLKIWNPRWLMQDTDNPTTLSIKPYNDFAESCCLLDKIGCSANGDRKAELFQSHWQSAEISIPDQKIGDFLNGLVDQIPRTNSDIHTLCERFSSGSNELKKLRDTPDKCDHVIVH